MKQLLDSYHQDKKRRCSSALEIANQGGALDHVLFPLAVRDNMDMLVQAGCSRAATFFQWFNFVSIFAGK